MSSVPDAEQRHGVRRWPWLVLAYLCLALAILGVVLPGLPTTPFVLAAAWAAARGSRRLQERLQQHRVFGPMIHDWRTRGAVSRRAKRAAAATMALCGVVMVLTAPKWWMSTIGISIMAIVATWLWRRPEP